MHDAQMSVRNMPVTMSSLDIAEMVGSRHDDVKRSIQRLAERGVIQHPPMADVKNHQNQTVTEYRITKRDSYVIVAQLSPEFTARLVDRWQELEGQVAPGGFEIPQSMSAALRLAADQQERLEAQEQELEAARPAVEFVEQYVRAGSGNKGFRQVCKLLGANEFEFRQFLADKKIMYRLGGEWTPYERHCNLGRFVVRTGTANGHAFNQGVFTARGVNWIAGLWAIHKLGLQA